MKGYFFKLFVIAAIAFSLMFMSVNINAQQIKWPERPLKNIVAFDVGGSVDRWSRGLSTFLGQELGAGVIVENRPGAIGQVAARYLLSLPPDGYAYLTYAQLFFSTTIIIHGAPYSIEDFAYANMDEFDPGAIFVHRDSPWQTLGELIDASKKEPVKISVVFGSGAHLVALILAEKLGLNFRFVTYPGGGEARSALLGKHVDAMALTLSGTIPISDLVRGLAVADSERSSSFPDMPTFAEALREAGYNIKVPNLGTGRFVAFPAEFRKKYPERWAKFIQAHKKVLESKGYQKYLKKMGTLPFTKWRGPEETERLIYEMHEVVKQYADMLKE